MTGELFRALAALVERPRAELQPVADAVELGPLPTAAEHADLFTLQLVPYASVYLSHDGRIGGEARDRIAGFWRALELQVPREPDHLVVQLQFVAELLTVEAGAEGSGLVAAQHRLRAFAAEHVLSWIPMYLTVVEEIGVSFYRRWGALLQSALVDLGDRIGDLQIGSVHRTAVEEWTGEPEEEIEALLRRLASPLRCGVILTRCDLARAGREIGVASRHGERRFMLQAMLQQRPQAVIDWLLDHLEGCARSYRRAIRAGSKGLGYPLQRIAELRHNLAAMSRRDG